MSGNYHLKLCTGDTKSILGNKLINKASKKRFDEFRPDYWDFRTPRPVGIKRIRLVCPKCGRRILASVSTCDDGCCLYFTIPPHKPKGWWKKRTPRWERRR